MNPEPHSASRKNSPETYASIRQFALGASSAGMGIASTLEEREPYGVLMEFNVSGMPVTITSFVSGDASLYFGNGGGVIGGIGHESVRAAAKQFVVLAKEFVPDFEVTTNYPQVKLGQVQFFILTSQGILTQVATERDLVAKTDALSPLYYEGHKVMTELRLVATK